MRCSKPHKQNRVPQEGKVVNRNAFDRASKKAHRKKELIMLKFVKICGNIIVYVDKGVQKDENAVSKQASKQASKQGHLCLDSFCIKLNNCYI